MKAKVNEFRTYTRAGGVSTLYIDLGLGLGSSDEVGRPQVDRTSYWQNNIWLLIAY
jgi:hypothetical protein